MEITWNYTDTRQYRQKIADGMPPLIISCAITGDHQNTENPNLPRSGEEQAEAAAASSRLRMAMPAPRRMFAFAAA